MQKKVLFGAGVMGKMALKKYGKDNVAYFIDNDKLLWGKKIEGIEIVDPQRIIADDTPYEIVITPKYNKQMIEQLKLLGIRDYTIFISEDIRIYPTDELIFNPYENKNAIFSNVSQQVREQRLKAIETEVSILHEQNEIFNVVQIETVNRCNGNCSFCPVNRRNDTREYVVMQQELFENIINQLSEMNYAGYLALFSNNEPFLDELIIERHKYVREKLPHAYLYLFTNGTLLTIDKFVGIMKYLNELIIDNYQQDLTLIKPCQEIVEYCEKFPHLKEKITIVLRKANEVLTNRGGDAPNRKDANISYPDAKCVLPYKQLIIRPDGKVSLCCNDPLGKDTLADLTKENLLEAWNNQNFKTVRECLYEGRKKWKHCMYCDVIDNGRRGRI